MKIRHLAAIGAAAAMLTTFTTANAQSTVTAYTGITRVTLSTQFTGALSALSVSVGQVNPTMISGSTADFLMVNGVIDLDTGSGNLVHSGGLTFQNGSTTVRLQSFIVDTTGKTPMLTAIVIVDDKVWGRFPLFDLTLPSNDSFPLKVKGNTLALGTANITLDASASAMLNNVYHVSQFTPGFPIGTADITAYVSRKDWTY